jgi:hypothetical protein
MEPIVLENLAKSVDLRIEALDTPTSPGPQDFQIRPASLLLSAAGDLLPTEVSLLAAIQVTLTVDWGIEDVEGNPLDQAEAVVCSRGSSTSDSLDRTLQATVMVAPDFVELVHDPTEIPAKTRYVTASVELKATKDGKELTTAKLPVLRHPITVPAIPIPTLAIFFAKPTLGVTETGDLQDGEQYALIVVPSNSPIGGVSAVRGVFDELMQITKTANQVAELAGFATGALPALLELGGGLDALLGALNAHKVLGSRVGVAFVAADSIPNLNNVDTILNVHWYNDVEAEDTISSFVFVGPPGRQLRCFQDRDYHGQHVTVTTGSAALAIVNDLLTAPPATLPETAPPATPPSAEQHGSTPLDNRLSALVFA